MKGFHSAIVNDFMLQSSYAECLESYYKLHWELQYLMTQLTDDMTIKHGGKEYIPIFKAGIVGSMNPKQQCVLSFRETAINSTIPNYVLIKAM